MRASWIGSSTEESLLHLPARAGLTCDMVDVLLGIRETGFFRFECDASCAAVLFAEVQRILSLQSAVLRLRCHDERVFDIRFGRFPDETLS